MSVSKEIEKHGTVAYKVAYAKVPGSDPICAIFLSQVAYWAVKAESRGTDWCFITHQRMEEQTGVGRKAQDRAAKFWSGIGVLRKRLIGIPAKIHYAVDFDRLDIIIAQGCSTGASKVDHLGQPALSQVDTLLRDSLEDSSENLSYGEDYAVTCTAPTMPDCNSMPDSVHDQARSEARSDSRGANAEAEKRAATIPSPPMPVTPSGISADASISSCEEIPTPPPTPAPPAPRRGAKPKAQEMTREEFVAWANAHPSYSKEAKDRAGIWWDKFEMQDWEDSRGNKVISRKGKFATWVRNGWIMNLETKASSRAGYNAPEILTGSEDPFA